MEIYVFKISVDNKADILKLKPYIEDLVQDGKWNFDLDDCDNIFRVETARDIHSSLILIFHGVNSG